MNEINQINKLNKEVGITSANIIDSLTALSLDNIFYNILIMKININDIKCNYEDQYFPTHFQLVLRWAFSLTPEEAMVDDLAKDCGTEKIIVLFIENPDLVSNIYIKNNIYAELTSGDGSNLGQLGIALCSIRLGSCIFQHHFIVCQSLMCAGILGIDFAKSCWIGTYWNGSGQVHLHQDHKLLTYSMTANQRDTSVVCPADCVDFQLVIQSKVLIPTETIALIPTKIYFFSLYKV